MAEAKNTFIQSKMNKDLDGRIIPNGQYRDGENVQISRSEGDDVGALENVLGNSLLTDLGFNDPTLTSIGVNFDTTSNCIYLFLTNYSDSSNNQLNNNCSGIAGANCYIVKYDLTSGQSKILVEGSFLNFSKTHLITGINLLEDLLFWTDNRNQPRKININQDTGYYYNEDQISVAKYYPFEAPILLNNNLDDDTSSVMYSSSMKDTTSKYLPIHAAAKVKEVNEGSGQVTLYGCYRNIKANTSATSFDGNLVTGGNISINGLLLDSVTLNCALSQTIITTSGGELDVDQGDILYFQYLNPDFIQGWSGDPDYLKDKFGRFSYRFRFEDREYSLSAPFTQIAFVPKQDGYFIGNKATDITFSTDPADDTKNANQTLVGQESEAFDTTIVSFMENKVCDINIGLLAPPSGSIGKRLTWDKVATELKVSEIDILFKMSDTNNVFIIDTLELSEFANLNSEYIYYNYQSKKPWKVLPTNQITRVTDVVPIKAQAQEVSGNRVIYGNFVDKHGSPARMDYVLTIGDKPPIPDSDADPEWKNHNFYVRKEYQNHTLKQNRTYQVGIILTDRYGRNSNIILSDFLPGNENQGTAKNSTIFHDYRSTQDRIIKNSDGFGLADTWPGDQLSVIFKNIIDEDKNPEIGYPGLYSEADGSVSSVVFNTPSLGTALSANTQLPSFNPPCETQLRIKSTTGYETAVINVVIGIGGVVETVVVVESSNGWKDGQPFVVDWQGLIIEDDCSAQLFGNNYGGNVVTSKSNPLGYYSYKIVVKQTEQDYYNVYMPTSLAGYPCNQNVDGKLNEQDGNVKQFVYPVNQENSTSHIVLFSDNINKVPRDLQEVGPTQELYRSNADLFFRVESFLLDATTKEFSSRQYQPNTSGNKVVSIANMSKLDLGELILSPSVPIIPNIFYKGDTDPLIGRVATDEKFGISIGENDGITNTCLNTGQPEFQQATNPDTDLPCQLGDTCYIEPNVTVWNSKYGYGPTLCIAETKPVESTIDIFYETSTSGLISELNNNIRFQDNTAPAGMSDPGISWEEGQDYNTPISSVFQAISGNGLPLGSSAAIELVKVVKAGSTVCTSQFELVDLGNGEYQVYIAPYNPNSNNNFIYSAINGQNYFNFTFDIINLSTQSRRTVVKNGEISNTKPNDRTNPPWTAIKSALGVASQPVTTWNTAESLQTMSLKAEKGYQKYGLTSYDSFSGAFFPTERAFYQYIAPEASFPNEEINFGQIRPTTQKYINANPWYMSDSTRTSSSWAYSQVQVMDSFFANFERSDRERTGGCKGTNAYLFWSTYADNLQNPGLYSGQLDYGWFGGPTGPGISKAPGNGIVTDPNQYNDFAKGTNDYKGSLNTTTNNSVSNKKGTVQFAPILRELYRYNSARRSQKIYALRPDRQGYSNRYPYPGNTSGKKGRKPVYIPCVQNQSDGEGIMPGWGEQLTWSISAGPYGNYGGTSNVVFPAETAFTDTVLYNGETLTWNGEFSAANGTWGSVQPDQTSPYGPGTGIEMEWSIPRMYQVSMMVPHGETFSVCSSYPKKYGDVDQLYNLAAGGGIAVAFGVTLGAAVFAVYVNDIDICWGITNASDTKTVQSQLMPGQRAAASTRGADAKSFDMQPAGEVIFGLYPKEWLDGNTDPRNRDYILKKMPSGPIYWDHESGTRPGSQGSDQMSADFGEAYVGQAQNNGRHYWPDIQHLIDTESEFAEYSEKVDDGVPDYSLAPNFMKLQHGSNTFYQWQRQYASWFAFCGISQSYVYPRGRGTGACGGRDADIIRQVGQWILNSGVTTAHETDKGYLFHLGGLSNKIGNPNSNIRFFAEQTHSGSPNQDDPSRAVVYAGNPSLPSQSWNPESLSNTLTSVMTGNGMPGGRYVVTLRATDVNGSGLYVEFDVPIQLPFWASRTNSPLR